MKDIVEERCLEYLTPQVGQNLEWQRKGTNFKWPHLEQAYMAPPKEGSPQLIILEIFSNSTSLGCNVY